MRGGGKGDLAVRTRKKRRCGEVCVKRIVVCVWMCVGGWMEISAHEEGGEGESETAWTDGSSLPGRRKEGQGAAGSG